MSDRILKEILGELKNINQRVGGLEEGQKELRSDVLEVKKGQLSLDEGQKGLKSDVSELKKGQLRLETRMENEVIEKIRALFDARQAGEEKLDQINGRLDNIETDTGYLVDRVAQLKGTVPGH